MTQDQAFKTRAALLEAVQNGLLEKTKKIQGKLFAELIERILQELITEGNVISSDKKNFIIARTVDNVFDQFQRSGNYGLAAAMVKDFNAISNINDTYFGTFGYNKARFERVQRKVRAFLKESIGIGADNKIKKGGFLDKLFKDNSIRNEVQKKTFKAITSGQPVSDLVTTIKTYVKGVSDVDGALIKHIKTFSNDLYSRYDRAQNFLYAKELKLYAFVYDGTIIETSREFCIDKEGKVFTIEEAEEWRNDPKLLRTKAEKETGVVTDYNPLEDFGRWECRHLGRYVSKAEALRRRPDLKGYYEGK